MTSSQRNKTQKGTKLKKKKQRKDKINSVEATACEISEAVTHIHS
jgi:hypothetical protein